MSLTTFCRLNKAIDCSDLEDAIENADITFRTKEKIFTKRRNVAWQPNVGYLSQNINVTEIHLC